MFRLETIVVLMKEELAFQIDIDHKHIHTYFKEEFTKSIYYFCN